MAENKVSRQRLWQRKMIGSGRCRCCGKPRNAYADLCDPCAAKRLKPRRPAMPGRVPRTPPPDPIQRQVLDRTTCSTASGQT